MQKRYSQLTISRAVHETEEARRFTAKIHHHANEAFGHDNSSLTSEGQERLSVGNPRYKVLSSLEHCLLYRAGTSDNNNRASSAWYAEERLMKSPQFQRGLRELRRRNDGIDFSDLELVFDSLALGSKPGYNTGEFQVVLQPKIELLESGILLSEAQICSSALGEASLRFGYPETPIIPGIPLLKLSADVTADQRTDFMKKIGANNVLPVRLRLGELEINPSDRRNIPPDLE